MEAMTNLKHTMRALPISSVNCFPGIATMAQLTVAKKTVKSPKLPKVNAAILSTVLPVIRTAAQTMRRPARRSRFFNRSFKKKKLKSEIKKGCRCAINVALTAKVWDKPKKYIMGANTVPTSPTTRSLETFFLVNFM